MAISYNLTRDLEDLAHGNSKAGPISGKIHYYIARLEKLSVYFYIRAENARG